MKEEEYKIIVNLIRNDVKCDIPKNVKTSVHRSAYVKYWRLKKDSSLDDNGQTLFQQRRILKKGELKSVAHKTFKKSLVSGGYKNSGLELLMAMLV